MRKLFLLSILFFTSIITYGQTSCQTSPGGNGFAGFTTISQSITMSGCTGDYLHSIELQKSGNQSNCQIIKVEVFSGASESSADLLYESNTLINLPDNHTGDFTISFNDGTCNAGGTDCLQFSDGEQFTIRFTFGNINNFWGIIANSSNGYAGGTPRINGTELASYDVSFDLFTSSINLVTTTLPVELTDFSVKNQDNQTNLLQWQTATEKNNEGFEIERSSNGENWQTFGFVQGNGTTQEEQNYTFTDETPFNGINYYRLKQVDFDGQFEYSMVEVVEIKTDKQPLSVFPNPVEDELNIINGEGQATIYNVLGQAVKQLSINNSQSTINTSDLPEGQYILHILQQNGNVVTKQFVK